MGEPSTVEDLSVEDVYRRIDLAEELISNWEEWGGRERQAAAESINGLTRTLRVLLLQHRERLPETTCGSCGVEWPCAVVRTAHSVLLDPENEFVRIASALLETWPQ
jgi:hypothetical protein